MKERIGIDNIKNRKKMGRVINPEYTKKVIENLLDQPVEGLLPHIMDVELLDDMIKELCVKNVKTETYKDIILNPLNGFHGVVFQKSEKLIYLAFIGCYNFKVTSNEKVCRERTAINNYINLPIEDFIECMNLIPGWIPDWYELWIKDMVVELKKKRENVRIKDIMSYCFDTSEGVPEMIAVYITDFYKNLGKVMPRLDRISRACTVIWLIMVVAPTAVYKYRKIFE